MPRAYQFTQYMIHPLNPAPRTHARILECNAVHIYPESKKKLIAKMLAQISHHPIIRFSAADDP
jgi:hypothetical protein